MTDYPQATTTVYTAQLLLDGAPVFDEIFDTEEERLARTCEQLLELFDEVDVEDHAACFDDITTDATQTLQDIILLYGDYSLDGHLSTMEQPVAPAELFTVITDYGIGEPTIAEHFPTEQLRLESLRERAEGYTEVTRAPQDPLVCFDHTDQHACADAIELALSPTGGKITLIEAVYSGQGTYRSEGL